MHVNRPCSLSSQSRALGMPFRTRSAHIVKFRPIRIECARKSPRQFPDAVGDSVAHVTSPSGFSSCGPFARGVCAKGTAFAANFRRKTIKNWCEITALAAQTLARLMNPCRNRGAADERTTEARRFLPGKHLIVTSAQPSRSEDLQGRALGRMFARGLEHGAVTPRA
jgi:hypothetical protein